MNINKGNKVGGVKATGLYRDKAGLRPKSPLKIKKEEFVVDMEGG